MRVLDARRKPSAPRRCARWDVGGAAPRSDVEASIRPDGITRKHEEIGRLGLNLPFNCLYILLQSFLYLGAAMQPKLNEQTSMHLLDFLHVEQGDEPVMTRLHRLL